MTSMESPDTESRLQNKSFDTGDASRNGSNSEILKEKSHGTDVMSGIHDSALIITICMARILAQSWLGQELIYAHKISPALANASLQPRCVSLETVLEWRTMDSWVGTLHHWIWRLAHSSLPLVCTSKVPEIPPFWPQSIGSLGDVYSYKKIFLIGTIWHGSWSLIAGFSVYSGTTLFSMCRGFQGIGPALVVPIALAIAGRSFKGKKKNWVFACFGASAPGS